MGDLGECGSWHQQEPVPRGADSIARGYRDLNGCKVEVAKAL